VKILTVTDVSEMLKVKLKTLYQWAELGLIPCMKLNGCLRFSFDEIHGWLQSCKKEARTGYNPSVQTTRGPRKGGKG
jgi:excisionase family DNA binding protein